MEDKTKVLRYISRAGAVLSGLPNAFLTCLFFLIALDDTSGLLPSSWGYEVILAVSVMLGLAFVLGELRANLAGERPTVIAIIILLLCAYVNIGAGNYRMNNAARVESNKSLAKVEADPRWSGLQEDREAANKMKSNGKLADDDKADSTLARVIREEKEIIAEYKRASHISTADIGGDLIDMVFANKRTFTFALITVNLIFGFCSRGSFTESLPADSLKIGETALRKGDFDSPDGPSPSKVSGDPVKFTSKQERIIALKKEGVKQKDIALQVGTGEPYVSQTISKWRKRGGGKNG